MNDKRLLAHSEASLTLDHRNRQLQQVSYNNRSNGWSTDYWDWRKRPCYHSLWFLVEIRSTVVRSLTSTRRKPWSSAARRWQVSAPLRRQSPVTIRRYFDSVLNDDKAGSRQQQSTGNRCTISVDRKWDFW